MRNVTVSIFLFSSPVKQQIKDCGRTVSERTAPLRTRLSRTTAGMSWLPIQIKLVE